MLIMSQDKNKLINLQNVSYFDVDWCLVQNIDDFFKQQAKPTLTEDEKVILRNIKEKKIGRLKNGNLYVTSGNYGRKYAYLRYFKHLFQFIKERTRI